MNESQLGFASGCVIVALKILVVWRLWNFPLNHGPGYFVGVAVPAGFYDGAGLRWLRSYHALLAVQCLLVTGVFAAVLISGRWSEMPILAPVDVTSFFALIGGFTLWARRIVGAPPAILPQAVAPFEPRRLADYNCWPGEGLMGALAAASWVVLLTAGAARFSWGWPVVSTYVVLALLPGKIILVRNSYPLPPERTDEYHRWLDMQRRHSLRLMSVMGWFAATALAGYSAQRSWRDEPWIPWLALLIEGAIFSTMMTIIFRGMARVAATGRNFRPVGSFSGPFRRSGLFVRGGLAWAIFYCAGLALLLIAFRN
ncbi:MAG: hypothetical protein IT165_08375 [Bryobacterales bacterium]|nr:hypothetical protein [Bryobacterales bacterium]